MPIIGKAACVVLAHQKQISVFERKKVKLEFLQNQFLSTDSLNAENDSTLVNQMNSKQLGFSLTGAALLTVISLTNGKILLAVAFAVIGSFIWASHFFSWKKKKREPSKRLVKAEIIMSLIGIIGIILLTIALLKFVRAFGASFQ